MAPSIGTEMEAGLSLPVSLQEGDESKASF